MIKQLFLLLFVLFSTRTFSPAQTVEDKIQLVENNLHLPTLTNSQVSALGKSIYEKLEEYKIPGASVAVIHDGSIDWTKSYGKIHAEKSEKVNKNTLFQCASIGKVITALAALKLVKEGYLKLDEPVNTKLKRWKIADNENTLKQPVTLRHLLSHSAGLTDEYGFLGYESRDQIPTILQILNNEAPAQGKKSLEIKSLPGTVERYSGAGYVIIQLLIEDLTETSFESYVRENIFNQLEMKNTTYCDTPDRSLSMEVAQGHIKNGVPIKDRTYNIYPEKAAAGPWTTANDLGLLIIEIQKAYQGESNLILNQSLAREMLSPQINHKGLGINLKGFEKVHAFWHAGQNLGYTALMYGTLDSKSGAVILINSDTGERLMQEFITSVSNVYDWSVMRSYKIRQLSDQEKTQVIGAYFSKKVSETIYVKEKKGEVFVSGSKKSKGYRLYKIGKNHYSFKDAQDYYKISFGDNYQSMRYSEGPGKELNLIKEPN